MENAQGDWIIFVDADDYLFNRSLEKLIQSVEKTKYDVTLACAYKYENSEYTPIYQIEEKDSDNICDLYEHYALWAYLFKKEIIKKHNIKFVDGLAYSEDMLFIIEYVSHCKRIKQINDFVYVYRINDTSACKSTDWQKTTLHQFWSASLLLKLANMHTRCNPFYVNVHKKVRDTVKLGISYFVESPSRIQYNKIKNMFRQYFKNREYNDFLFFIDYMHILCKSYIKRIIK